MPRSRNLANSSAITGRQKKDPRGLPATFFLEKVQLFLGLHAFGDHAVLQTLSDADERAQDRGILRVGRNVVYQATVDFQSIQWEFSQITEAGIAHSKIVDGQLHADGFEGT